MARTISFSRSPARSTTTSRRAERRRCGRPWLAAARPDVATITFCAVTIRLTQPAGPPFPTSIHGLAGGTSSALFLAEVNGDGVMDVGVAGFSTGTQLRLYPVVGGVLQTPLAFTLAGETMPMPREAVPTFETCWAVLTALSVVPPEKEGLLRPLTR